MYVCDKCGKEFKYKSHYNRHKSVKNNCLKIEYFDTKINNVDIEIGDIDKKITNLNKDINITIYKSLENETKCLFCKSKFLNKNNIMKHIENVCIMKKYMISERSNLINDKKILIEEKNKILEKKNKIIEENRIQEREKERDNEIKQLRRDISKLLKKQKPVINQTINNNTQNNLIVINPFGKEDLSHVKLQDYKNYLNSFFPGFIKYVEKVHFDESAPQNHNICISNLKSKYLSIHDGDKWITKEKNDVIDKLIIKKHNQLADKCEELEEKKQIDKTILENFEEFCESFKDKDAQKTIKTNLITMLYDNNGKITNQIKNKSIKKIDYSELESETETESEEDLKPIKINKNKQKKIIA